MTSAGQLNLRCRGKISLKLHWRQQSSSWCLIQRFDGTGPLALADVDRNWPKCSTFLFQGSFYPSHLVCSLLFSGFPCSTFDIAKRSSLDLSLFEAPWLRKERCSCRLLPDARCGSSIDAQPTASCLDFGTLVGSLAPHSLRLNLPFASPG